MTLRADPSIRNWPPAWTRIGGSGDANLRGEIGTLRSVEISRIEPTRICYLTIDFGSSSYMGALLLDDEIACRQTYEVLQYRIGCSIQEIGDLELRRTP
jgi:hypothetical protein